MSYAGVESESEYAQRTYGLVPKETKTRKYDEGYTKGHHDGFLVAKQRLIRRAAALAGNDNISWEEAFEKLQLEIKEL